MLQQVINLTQPAVSRPGAIPETQPMMRVLSYRNGAKTAQVYSLEVTATTAAITMKRNGITKTFSTTGTGSNALAAADLLAKIQADATANGWVYVSRDSATLTLTTRHAGTVFAVVYSGASGITASETTAAADQVSLRFGVFVARASTAGQVTSVTGQAKIVTLAPSAANSTVYSFVIRRADTGAQKLFSITSDSSATVKQICDAVTAAFSFTGFTCSDDDTTLTITGPSGVDYDLTLVGAGVFAVAVTQNAGFARQLAGITLTSDTIALAAPTSDFTDALNSYPAGTLAEVAESGVVLALCDDTVADGDPVYVRVTASGSEVVGSVRNDSDSGDCILLPGARFLGASVGSSADPVGAKIQFDCTRRA